MRNSDKNHWKNLRLQSIFLALYFVVLCCQGCSNAYNTNDEVTSELNIDTNEEIADEEITSEETTDKEPENQADEELVTYKSSSDETYITLNNNIPKFSEEEMKNVEAFETYSELDSLDRCGVAYANICKEIMPTEERGKIGQIKPSGWHLIKYDIVEGKYLYNRCHLIGFQLAGENANEKNLITGTRFFNVVGMLPFENEVADYVDETDNHVLYRVTPVFEGNDLVASGVQMEAYSVEDEGKGVCFNVFVYNKQPGVEIDYSSGESILLDTVIDSEKIEDKTAADSQTQTYILNTNTKKIHAPHCSSVDEMREKNKKQVESTIDQLLAEGYSVCKRCNAH